MTAKGYDFLAWIGKTSGPSCAKLVNDTDEWFTWWVFPVERVLAVTPGARLRGEIMVKQEGCPGPYKSHLAVRSANLSDYPWIVNLGITNGTFDWSKFTFEADVPPNVSSVMIYFATAPKGTNWFDDLKIYQDDVLIYADDFSNWDPLIGAGVGAPIGGVAGYLLKEPLGPMVSEVVGAVVCGALGGGVGLLTGLGIIPVPQIPIPSLGAAPEEPGAPMRLGKYQITG